MRDRVWMKVEIWEDGHRYLMKIDEAIPIEEAYPQVRQMIRKLGMDDLDRKFNDDMIHEFIFGE